MNVAKEFVRFTKKTSLRGVSRIGNAEFYYLKMLWILAVVVGLTGTIFFVLQLFSNYFSYKTVVNMELRNTKATFPDVSICRQQEVHYQNNGYEEYMEKIDNILKNYSGDERNLISRQFRNIFGFYQNVDILKDEAPSSLVVDCKWAEWIVGGSVNAIRRNDGDDSHKCDFKTDIIRFEMPELSECYTFSAHSKKKSNPQKLWWQRDNKIRGLSVILYMGHTSYQDLPMNDMHFTQSHGRGYKVEVHPRKNFPHMAYALKFAPGFETSMRINPLVRESLGPPYGGCSAKASAEFNGSEIQDYAYSRHFCRASCRQSSYVANCGCLSVDIHASKTMYTNYPFCGRLHEDFNTTLQRLYCLENTKTTFCKDSCPISCKLLTYSLEIGSEMWPHENFMSDFYRRYIKGRPYEKHFTEVKDILQHINKSELNHTESGQFYEDIVKARNLISMNFAQLNVFFKNNEIRLYKDVEAMNLPTLISNMGGTFNLWIGITFFTLIELAELVLRLLCVTDDSKVKSPKGNED